MAVAMLFLLACVSGFFLYSRVRLEGGGRPPTGGKVSVIIPARNEEKNLPFLLGSLAEQSVKPEEIIVVDDFSSDRTVETAQKYGVRIVRNTELPENWTGKTWAVWNGFLESKGDVLVFLDADVRLAPGALEALLKSREKTGGVISVVPYHETKKFYERLSMLPCLLGVFAFTSPFERRNPSKGLYGSCIVAAREDYLKVNGHKSIRAELLDDLNLGKKFSEAGVPVKNYIGYGLVSFRMYPNGLQSEMQGFGKGAVLSTATLRPATVLLIAFWIAGLFISEFATPFLFLSGSALAYPFLAGYIIYMLQIIYLLRSTGRFGWVMPVLHILSSVFFILVMLYSAYQVVFRKSVVWKGRRIRVGGGKDR